MKDEYEVTCRITKGERALAYGDDCFCWYPRLNYNERIVRCRDCKHYVLDWEIDEERKCCARLSKPLDEPLFPGDTGFCAWGEPKD